MRKQSELKIRIPETLKTKFTEFAKCKRKSVSVLIRDFMTKTTRYKDRNDN